MNNKPIQHAISVIIENDQGQTLFVLRSEKANTFPLTWSLPANNIALDENYRDIIKKIGKEKLGLDLEPLELIIEGKQEREEYVLFMHDYRAKIISGEIKINSDFYADFKWAEPKAFLDSLDKMGKCTLLYKKFLSQ